MTLSVTHDPEAQSFFQAVIEAIKARPITTLQLRHSYLDSESYQALSGALLDAKVNWASTLDDISMPFQTMEDIGKSAEVPLDCGIQILTKVKALNVKKGQPEYRNIRIRAWGQQQQSYPNLRANGSPFKTFQNFLQRLDVLDGWDVIDLLGNQACDADVGNTMTALDIYQPSLPVRITKLSLVGFDFDRLHRTDFDRLDTSRIRHLLIRDCRDLPKLFEFFLRNPNAPNLESFSYQMWYVEEVLSNTHQFGIEPFLLSFSGLKHLKIHVRGKWNLDMDRITAQHHTLESLEYSTGDSDISPESLDSIIRNLPTLKLLCFRLSLVAGLVSQDASTKHCTRILRSALSHLVSIWKLEDLVLIFRAPHLRRRTLYGPSKMEMNLKIAADEIRSMVYANDIKRIQLWMRNSRYRLSPQLRSNVPAPYVFEYGDD